MNPVKHKLFSHQTEDATAKRSAKAAEDAARLPLAAAAVATPSLALSALAVVTHIRKSS